MLQLIIIILTTFAILVVVFASLSKHYRETEKIEKALQLHSEAVHNCRSNSKQLMMIAKKLDMKIKSEKMYINPNLSIQDVAAAIGTNRSYISSTINTVFHQNFCTYINQFRFQELVDLINTGEDYSHKELATKCGFGSIDSMKRTVKLKTGLSLRELINTSRRMENHTFQTDRGFQFCLIPQ